MSAKTSFKDLPSTEGEIKEPEYVEKITGNGVKYFEINSKFFARAFEFLDARF